MQVIFFIAGIDYFMNQTKNHLIWPRFVAHWMILLTRLLLYIVTLLLHTYPLFCCDVLVSTQE